MGRKQKRGGGTAEQRKKHRSEVVGHDADSAGARSAQLAREQLPLAQVNKVWEWGEEHGAVVADGVSLSHDDDGAPRGAGEPALRGHRSAWTVHLIAARSFEPGELVYTIPPTATLTVDGHGDGGPVCDMLERDVTTPPPVDRWATDDDESDDGGSPVLDPRSGGSAAGPAMALDDPRAAMPTRRASTTPDDDEGAHENEDEDAEGGSGGCGGSSSEGGSDDEEEWDHSPFEPDGGPVYRDLRWVRAALLFMHGRLMGEAAEPGWGIIAALPDFATLRHPLLWTAHELEALGGLSVAGEVRQDLADLGQEYAAVADLVSAHHDELFPAGVHGGGGCELLYRQCSTVLASSGCPGAEGEPIVVPTMALLERAADGNCAFDPDDDAEGMALVTTEFVPEGARLRLTAEPESFSELFRVFALTPTALAFPGDRLSFSLDDLATADAGAAALRANHAALYARKDKLLRDRGFLCSRDHGVFELNCDDVAVFECPTSGSVPRIVVAALVLTLTLDELETFENANHVALESDDEEGVGSDSEADSESHGDDDGDDCPDLVPPRSAEVVAAARGAVTNVAAASAAVVIPWVEQARGWRCVVAALEARQTATAPGAAPKPSRSWRPWVEPMATTAREAEHQLCGDMLATIGDGIKEY